MVRSAARALGATPVVVMVMGGLLLCYGLLAFIALPSMLHIENGCRMSRMYPSYVSHNEALRLHSRSASPVMSKYSLLEYREWDERKRPIGEKSAMAALFIPGNAGSYGQVRSMASSGATQYWVTTAPIHGPERDKPQEEWKDGPGPVDWYTLDFNEDFSAFHGQTLRDQAYFVNEVVHYLRSIYPAPDSEKMRVDERNVTVSLVAHSMGGIVARLAPYLPNYVPGSIDTIITLSTPHAFPPVPIDRSLEGVYEQVNHQPPPHDEPAPLLISLAGGVLDTQLSSDASALALAGIQTPLTRISSFTTALSMLWSSVDHLAAVWCDQLRYKIARGLLLDYKYFGKVAEERNEPDERIERHELWRKLLGVPLDGATAEEVHLDAIAAQIGPPPLRDLSPRFERKGEGDTNVFKPQPGTEIHQIVQGPGPRTVHEWPVQPDESLSFELLTNLGVGPSPNTGPSVMQAIELVTVLCQRTITLDDPTKMGRAWCHAVLPTHYESLPPSPAPQNAPQYLMDFPNASLVYESPPASIKRLRLSADFLRENHIHFIRTEHRLQDGAYAGVGSLHNQTLLTSGWDEEDVPVLPGAPFAGSKTWALPGMDLPNLLSSQTPEGHGPHWSWVWPQVDSSLLAYDLELEPAACALNPNVTFVPRTAPILRVSNRVTKDARVYPSLDVTKKVRVPMALHGNAPFMPRSRRGSGGTLLELWVPDRFEGTVFSNTYNMKCPLPFDRVRLRVRWRASAALLVLRYRFALLAWPIAVLALAHTRFFASNQMMPTDALGGLATRRSMLGLLSAPFWVQLAARTAEAIGMHGRWYSLGVGTTDLRFALLGPLLMFLAYAMAMLLALVSEMSVHLLYHALLRYAPHWVPLLAASPALPATKLPSRAELMQWAKDRRTIASVALLVGCWIVLPYQVLVLSGFLMHLVTLFGSYIAWQEAEKAPRAAQPAEWETDVAPHETQHARTLRALQSQHAQHAWLHLFLMWMLPLHIPILVVWVRNVNVSIRMGLTRTEHGIAASMFLLALVYLYASPTLYERPKHKRYMHITKGVYMVLFATSLVYGIRFTYTQYEVFQLVLAWEVLHRLYALYALPPPPEVRQGEREIFVLEPVHSALPDAVQGPEDVPSITASLATPAPESDTARADRLDEAWAAYLATLEEYLAARAAMSTSIAAGFTQLAKAKVALGGSFGMRVSQDMYDARMKARVHVNDGHLEPVQDERVQGEPVASTSETGLRRRRAAASNEDATEKPAAENAAETPSKEEAAEPKEAPARAPIGFDPLFQFSGLPPPSLRSAQQHFRDALATLVDTQTPIASVSSTDAISTLQQRLVDLENKIRACRSDTV